MFVPLNDRVKQHRGATLPNARAREQARTGGLCAARLPRTTRACASEERRQCPPASFPRLESACNHAQSPRSKQRKGWLATPKGCRSPYGIRSEERLKSCAIPMDSLWTPYGLPMDSLWTSYGTTPSHHRNNTGPVQRSPARSSEAFRSVQDPLSGDSRQPARVACGAGANRDCQKGPHWANGRRVSMNMPTRNRVNSL